MMTTNEVLDCLLALGITVQQEDVTKPSPQSGQMIFAALLDALMGAPMDLMEQPRAALMGMMEYKVGPPWGMRAKLTIEQELYGDALQFTMFFRHWRVAEIIE